MSNILPRPWRTSRLRNVSACRRQRFGQGDALVVRQRGSPQRAHSIGRISTRLARLRVGQYRIETRGSPLMRCAVPLDELLTVGDLDGQWVILPRHAYDKVKQASA